MFSNHAAFDRRSCGKKKKNYTTISQQIAKVKLLTRTRLSIGARLLVRNAGTLNLRLLYL